MESTAHKKSSNMAGFSALAGRIARQNHFQNVANYGLHNQGIALAPFRRADPVAIISKSMLPCYRDEKM